MEILKIRVMRGPNVWSVYRTKLIYIKLDLGKYENFPTNKIHGFANALETLMPTLYDHHCSEGKEGGFLQRVQEGTWLGHVIEHIALELQTLAGMDCGFGRTRSTDVAGVYHIVFSYVIENAGIYAAQAACRIAEKLVAGDQYDIEEDIKELRKIYSREQYGPTSLSLIREAEKRDIPYTRMNNNSMLMLGQGNRQKLVCTSVASTTSNMAVNMASDKEKTKRLLSREYIPVPKGTVIYREKHLREAIDEIGFPLVAKPIDGNHGRGITARIQTYEQALTAFRYAQTVSEDVIIEQYIQGTDFRFLLVNFKLVAVAKRTPAMVTGDGNSTIQQLVDEVNSDPRRGEGHEKNLTKIKIDKGTEEILEERKLSLDSVLPAGEILFLKSTANISSGGTATDVTDLVHPDNVFMAERVARLMNLDICGIDVMAESIETPISENGGTILEVNAGPGFRMHLSPSNGLARNVAAPVIDMLYPNNAPSRIPVVAVTGTNGKTTTTRLVAHLAKHAGHLVGFTTTDGIFIDHHMVYYGDCSGPSSAQTVLRDPAVDFAVLECARGGIMRSGLGFDKCNISIVTNISEDHIGLDGLRTLVDLANVKAVVPQTTVSDGYAILNADDDLVYAMRRDLDCRIALFSMDSNSSRIKRHCSNGGLTAIIDDGYFVICDAGWKTRIMKVEDVPLTFSGKAECMIKNILPAILAAFISKFSTAQIVDALKTFIPSPELTPGRMNLFAFNRFNVMVDYVHNEGGYIELKKYIQSVNASAKIGVISATGDRRDSDIQNIGLYAAQMFDELIVKHDKDGRGRTNDQITEQIMEGIKRAKKDIPVKVISDETQAIQYAIDHASKDCFIFITADEVKETLETVTRIQKNMDQLVNVA
ncbi:MAG: cyanophycin synthetase [Bacteroidetes bacterium]|jgi:cyanophycin synthetase|nr:cyanophycin synthetase [Bacteroidota bacterium]MDF2450564.1 cyanophycin synthetase [Bacteroidota bacterium]